MEVLPSSDAVAHRAAAIIASNARNAVSHHGKFVMAVSGGRTPWLMLSALANEEIPWDVVHIFQVDERVAPSGDPDRNLTRLRESLLDQSRARDVHIHAMPVEATDLEQAAREYANCLKEFAGTPPVLDLVHLGLGSDGHTASLIPGDPILEIADRDVAVTSGTYQGRRRMTLTYPTLNRARRILWVVTGEEKAPMLNRLRRADKTIPAGRIRQDNAIVLADGTAAGSSRPSV